jgi:putative N6-adenine-specific DNA methylase
LAPLKTFDCHSDKYLYKTALSIEWSDFINPDLSFAVFASVSNSYIKHSKYAALKVKDAIADYFMNAVGKRPDVDTREPDVWINLHIENNKAVISIDISGGSLHRRGYRKKTVEAPMVETLAAAIIRYSGWDGSKPLYDPFCGSGALLCEAYLEASATAPTFLIRSFRFERLPDFSKEIFQNLRDEQSRNKKSIKPGLISGSDISATAINAAMRNCSILDRDNSVQLYQKDIFEIDKLQDSVIITNPPYGIRLKQNQDLSGFYKNLGDFLKQRCTGSEAYIYFGERKYIKNIGLKPSWKKVLSNGGLDGRLAKYELF